MFQPLVLWCLCFCLGIVAASCLSLPPVFFVIVVAGLLFSSWRLLRKGRLVNAGILCLAFCLGALDYHVAAFMPTPPDHYAHLEGRDVTVRGVVVSDPRLSARKASFMLRLAGNRDVFVESYARRAYRYGDEVMLEGRFYAPQRLHWNSKKSRVRLTVKKEGRAFILRHGRGNFLRAGILAIKHKTENLIALNLPRPFSDVLLAMILGEAGRVPPQIKEAMITTGTWHLMVVSGSHTALLALMLLLILKIFCLPRFLRFNLTILFLFVYALLTGASSPVVRATVMTSAFLVSFLLKRNPHFPNSLALAALAILIFDPNELFNVGFQLSFLSVFCIFWLYPKFKKLIPEHIWQHRVFSWGTNVFLVSVCAWLGTSPLLAYWFGRLSLVAVLANMIAAPLAAVLMGAGFVLLVFGGFVSPLASWVALGCEALILLFVRACFFMARFPWASFSFAPIPLASTLILYGLVIYAALFLLPQEGGFKGE